MINLVFFTIEIVRFVLGYSSVLFSSKSLISSIGYVIVVVRYSNRRGIVNDDFVWFNDNKKWELWFISNNHIQGTIAIKYANADGQNLVYLF
jgi:hypothetical protein